MLMMRFTKSCFCILMLQQCSIAATESSRSLGAPTTENLEQQDVPPIGSKTQATTVSWLLFGGMTMIMMVFYFLSYKDKDIVDGTWLVISNAISLFCAVLLFLSFRDFVALVTDGEEVRRLGASDDWGQCWGSDSDNRRLVDVLSRRLAGVPTQKTLAVDGFCVVVMFVAWESILFLVRKKATYLSALGLIAAHCIGFATLYAFGNMQQCEPFRNSPGLSLVVIILAVPALILSSALGGLLRHKVAILLGADAHEDTNVHNFIHQCLHTEREALAFAVSFLLAQVLQYVATQSLAPLHAVPKDRELGNAVAEFCFVLGLAVTVVAAGFLEHAIASQHGHHDLSHDEHHGHELSRSQLVVHMMKDTLAFTTGWTLLHAIKLLFWNATNDKGLLGEGDVMTSHIMIVFISSAVTFLMFFVIDFAADHIHGLFARGLRALGKAFMLLLGLAWEGAFWEGAHSMSAGMEFDDKNSRMLAVIVSSLAFCAIVMPAWIMYIVPHTIELKNNELHVKDYDDHDSPASSPRAQHKSIDFRLPGLRLPKSSGDALRNMMPTLSGDALRNMMPTASADALRNMLPTLSGDELKHLLSTMSGDALRNMMAVISASGQRHSESKDNTQPDTDGQESRPVADMAHESLGTENVKDQIDLETI